MGEFSNSRISEKRKAEYQVIYDKIIRRSLGRRHVFGEHERHHVLPRSLGGSDDSNNIVSLTYREHFLAHWILTKIYSGDQQKRMRYALYRMSTKSDSNNRIISSWQYTIARKAKHLATLGNEYGRGHKPSAERIEILKQTMKNNKMALGHRFLYTEEQKERRREQMKGNKNGRGNLGKIRSPETRIKIGDSCRGGKSSNSRSVLCLNDGKIYLSMSEAAKFYGIAWQSISRICRGERKSTKGYKFCYQEKGT